MKDKKLKKSLLKSGINLLQNINLEDIEDTDLAISIYQNNQTKFTIEVLFDDYADYLLTKARSLMELKGDFK